MAFTGITANEADIDRKTGAGVSSSYTDTMKTEALLEAEAWLSAETRFNWNDEFSSLNTDVQNIVTNITASYVAIEAVDYDHNGYPSILSATTKMDFLWDRVEKGVRSLKELKKRKFVIGA